VETAAALIKNGGFSLGLQMMTGLFGEENTEKSALHTMDSFIALKPDTVRIYPALVVKNTLLAKWWQEGIYTPQTVEDATSLCAKLIVGFENAKIKVIRVGLHADTELENNFLAGPYHPAFKQICESKIYFEKISTLLKTVQKGDVTLQIPKGETSTVAGQKKCMLAEFKSMGYNINLQENEKLTGRMINIMP
ncbi:MAG: radical SAM protein, partial [Oscillospiraceae bacterium]